MQYHIVTFGCQMNKSDSKRIATVLENLGYKKSSFVSEADLIVVNMCSVRQSAVDRVHGKTKAFINLKKKNPKLKTLLTGCVLKKDLRKFKERFDYILSVKALPHWRECLAAEEKFFYYPDPRKPYSQEKFDSHYLKIKPRYSSSFSAFVPISTGCNNFCSFCVVPYTRGPEVSRSAKEILEEIRELSKRGFKEIWLLGQNVNSYKSELRIKNKGLRIINFPQLLKMVDEIPGNFWVRFTSSHPKDFSDELIRAVGEYKKVTEYINLPVQSGDNEVLKRMNRPYTNEEYKNLARKIKKRIANVCLSTDVIVGFPGETEEQFKNTVNLFKEIKFDMAYIAEYSPRPQTAAYDLEDNIPQKEKQKRREILTQVLKETALENNKKRIGEVLDVLVDTKKDGFLIGKTRNYKTVKFPSSKNLIGKFEKVEIIDALPWGLKGKLWKN